MIDGHPGLLAKLLAKRPLAAALLLAETLQNKGAAKAGRQRGQQDHRSLAAYGAAGGHHQQGSQRFYQAGGRIKHAVAGLEGFHIVGWRMGSCTGAPLPEPEQGASRKTAERGRQ